MDLNVEQQRKAVNYTLLFLNNETESIKRSIDKCTDNDSKKLLIQRFNELETDLLIFEQIGDNF